MTLSVFDKMIQAIKEDFIEPEHLKKIDWELLSCYYDRREYYIQQLNFPTVRTTTVRVEHP